MRRNPGTTLLILGLSVAAVSAQSPSADDRATLLRGIEAKREKYASVAKEIWGYAEVGFQEQKSSALLQQELRAAGFTDIRIAGEPCPVWGITWKGKPWSLPIVARAPSE